MRVTNWKRWQRTKGIVSFVLFLSAIGFAGGLEGDATTPIPSPIGFLICLALSTALMLNVSKRIR